MVLVDVQVKPVPELLTINRLLALPSVVKPVPPLLMAKVEVLVKTLALDQ